MYADRLDGQCLHVRSDLVRFAGCPVLINLYTQTVTADEIIDGGNERRQVALYTAYTLVFPRSGVAGQPDYRLYPVIDQLLKEDPESAGVAVVVMTRAGDR